jgi:hypothetical protein
LSDFKEQFPNKVKEFCQANNQVALIHLPREQQLLDKMTKLNLFSALKAVWPQGVPEEATPAQKAWRDGKKWFHVHSYWITTKVKVFIDSECYSCDLS